MFGVDSGLGAVGGLLGANEALKGFGEAQRNAQEAGRFTPWNITSGIGSTTFGPGSATATLSPEYQALRNLYLGNAGAGASAAGAFDPNVAANNFYGLMQAQASPYETQDRANAIAQLQGMGTLGLGTGQFGDNPLYSSLLRAQADAARQRQISSYGMSQDIANQLQQRALGWGGAGMGLDQMGLQGIGLGGQLGGLSTSAALNAAKLAQLPIMLQGLTKGAMLSGLFGGGGGTGGGLFGSGGFFGGGGGGSAGGGGGLIGDFPPEAMAAFA